MFKTVKCAMAFSLHLSKSNVKAVILKTMLQSIWLYMPSCNGGP